ncbi:MAG TPA: lectin-like protein [Labilithrix sp.]
MKTRRNFGDAAHDCASMKRRLAHLDDDAKNRALFDAIGSKMGYGSGMWLGCSDADKEGEWQCNGAPMSFTNWAPGQPDNATALDDCLEWFADTGQWNDASCDWKLGFVCDGRNVKCGGKSVGRFCTHTDARDWDGAKKACEAEGGKLAAPASAEESRALFDAMKLPSGVPSRRPLEGVWIGLSDVKEEGKFRWSDDTPVAWSNWLPGQPDDADKNEDCVTFTLGDGRWNDLECGTPLPYVCE